MKRVNGKYYDWADVDIQIPGLTLEVQEIAYDDEMEKEAVYGKGNMPRGYGTGNYKASGKLSLLRDDYNDLVNYYKEKKIPFYKAVIPKIIVNYGMDGEPMVTDVLESVTFTKRGGGGAKQADKNITVDLDFIIFGKIIYDGLQPV